MPLLWAVRRVSLPKALGLAALWGVLSGYAIAEPFPPSISQYFEQPVWVGWAFAVGLFAVMASPYYMLFVALDRGLAAGRGRAWHPFVVACAWIAVEWLRGRLFTETVFFIGNPWGQLGASQLAALPLVQIAAWTGLYGPSFLVALVNAVIADALAAREHGAHEQGGWQARDAGARFALVALPIVASLVYGWSVLPPFDPEPPGAVRVAAWQRSTSGCPTPTCRCSPWPRARYRNCTSG